jgi:hypothetical protein
MMNSGFVRSLPLKEWPESDLTLIREAERDRKEVGSSKQLWCATA